MTNNLSEKKSANAMPLLTKGLWVTLSLVAVFGFTMLFHVWFDSQPLGADFHTFWLAARATFMEGKNPYSQEVTLQSQIAIYGRPATPDQDQVAFAYPLFSLFALAPIVWLEYPWAESFWLALNILLVMTAGLLVFPKAPRWFVILLLLFYPLVFGLLLGNFVVTISIILLIFFGKFVIEDHPSPLLQIVLGFCLAWSTCKPQFVWLFLVFIVLVSIQKKYWQFLLSLVVSLILLIGGSFVLIPSWFSQWIQRIGEYTSYVQGQPTVTNLLELFLPKTTSLIITILIGILSLSVSFILVVRWWHHYVSDIFLFCWFGFLTYFFHLHGISYEQLAFIIPLFCWAAMTYSSRKLDLPFFAFIVFPVILSWGIFIISKWYFTPADEWPVLYFLVFLIWLYRQPGSQIPQQRQMAQIGG